MYEKIISWVGSCFLISSVCYCKPEGLPNEIHYELQTSNLFKPWKPACIDRFHGDYWHSNGTYSCGIFLVYYHDLALNPPLQIDGVIIEIEDLAMKPSIKIVQGLIYNKEKNLLSNGDVDITPVEAKFPHESKWPFGLVYKNNFYKGSPVKSE